MAIYKLPVTCGPTSEQMASIEQEYIYPHKDMRKIKWPSAVTRPTTHFICGPMTEQMASIEKSMVVHDTECPS